MAENFKGCVYPIQKSPKGYFHSSDDVEQIKSDMLQLLLTSPGERIMLPLYGTPLKQFIFEFNDGITEELVRDAIISALNLFEPRVAITDIFVSKKIDESLLDIDDDKQEIDHILYIQINFRDPQNIQKIHELKLELPLS